MGGKMKYHHKWTEEEKEIVRCDYKGTHASTREIAAKLGGGITEYAVRGRVYKMGLALKTDRHPWDSKQDDQLKELLPRYCVEEVSKRMHRSVNSVVVRAKRLHLYRRSHDGWFTKKEVCEMLGVDHHWLQRRIDSGALKATYHNGRRPTRIGLAMWHIEEEDLRKFLRRYPQDLTGRNVDLIEIVEILAGIDYKVVGEYEGR